MDALIQFGRQKKSIVPAFSKDTESVFNENSISAPKGLYFDKGHTWAFMEKNGVVKLGIDDFLLRTIGPLNKLLLKLPGEKIQKGEPALTLIQNGKQLTLNAPISGTVIFRNNQIVDNTSHINTSHLNQGWIYCIEPSNWQRESQFLFMADKYKEWLKNEFTRLKDFLAHTLQKSNPDIVPVILQDGGELKDNVLELLGPEVWEEFQSKFINISK